MKRFNKFLAVVMACFIVTACEDALDKLPLDAPADQTFFSSQTDLNLALTGAYRDIYWRSGSLPFHALLDGATDLGFLRTDFSGLQSYSMGSHSSTTAAFEATWDRMYSGIGRCNNLLDNMHRAQDVVSPEFYKQIEAEAKFLRAYYYSWLIQLYGDVPFVTTVAENIEASKIAKTSKGAIAQALYDDIDAAALVLSPTEEGGRKGHATQGAAWALKARIALNNGDYDIAAAAAKKVMDSNEYTLHADYGELFTYAGENSEEAILSMPHKVGFMVVALPREQGSRNGNGYSQIVPSQFMIDSYECTDGKTIEESEDYDPSKPFENRDPRLEASIVRSGAEFATYIYTNDPGTKTTQRIVDGVVSTVPNQDFTNAFHSFTGYLWRKYSAPEDVPANVTNGELDWILMRYAEVLLIYAESKIELGEIDQTVLDAINLIRARAYGVDISATADYPAITTTDQGELRTILRRERKIELAHEGFRMTDIHRWNIAQHVMPGWLLGRPNSVYAAMTFVPTFDEHGHPHYNGGESLYRKVHERVFMPSRDNLWAIPQNDINVNKNLIQNPNY